MGLAIFFAVVQSMAFFVAIKRVTDFRNFLVVRAGVTGEMGTIFDDTGAAGEGGKAVMAVLGGFFSYAIVIGDKGFSLNCAT